MPEAQGLGAPLRAGTTEVPNNSAVDSLDYFIPPMQAPPIIIFQKSVFGKIITFTVSG
jgi:hypothetical protein